MRQGSITTVICAAALLSAACSTGPKRAPVIAEAYVGPAVLKIRSDFPLQSSAVATVKHGDRLEIIQRRRKFLKVRTPSGAEGWTDESQLLNAADMQDLRDLAAQSAKMPSQGVATTFGDLNIHTQPTRGSPSFLQIKEGDKVDVLTHVVTPQIDAPRRPLIPPAPKKKPAPPKKPKKDVKYPPPPVPLPPGPPPNWLDLSKTERENEEPVDEPEAKPVPVDDWTLIRNKTGQSGWARTRRLSMAIPDEVAQYAEGRRIVSYFPLGYVQDEDAKKPIWLWTTIGGGHQDYDFDSFRVFIWSLRRHRYETAYIDRNLHGYSPVLLNEVDFSLGKTAAPAKYPGFSICVEKADGLHRREYALLGNVVRYAGDRPCEKPAPVWVAKATPGTTATPLAPAVPPPSASFTERVRTRVKSWFQKKAAQ